MQLRQCIIIILKKKLNKSIQYYGEKSIKKIYNINRKVLYCKLLILDIWYIAYIKN